MEGITCESSEVSWGLITNWFSTRRARSDCNSNVATPVHALCTQHCVNKDLESTWEK